MLASTPRFLSRTTRFRSFYTASLLRTPNELPKPPRTIDDSTSALDYKSTQRIRPPPLPVSDVPRSRSAEEAVTNILYNTPPPNLQPYKKYVFFSRQLHPCPGISMSLMNVFSCRHILNCLVQNEPGVLSRVSSILAGRGFNIDSLVVCRTEIRDLSRMSIVISGQDSVVEQARRQLEDLVCNPHLSTLPFSGRSVSTRRRVFNELSQVPVWAVLDYTDTRVISRELLLVKVSILGPEYLEDQFVGGPSHEARRSHPHSHAPSSVSSSSASKAEREAMLAHNFERSGHPETATTDSQTPLPLTASEALRLKHQHLQSISVLANQFGAKIVDVSDNSVIVELTAKTNRVVAFLNLLKPFGILESARTGGCFLSRRFCGRWSDTTRFQGLMAMPRTPIARSRDDADDISEEGGGVDASLLPPG